WNADKSASKEDSPSEQNPPAERSPDTAATKTATNPPAPNAKPPWPDTRHAGSRTPSGERPRHENKTPHCRRPRRPANHPRMQGRIRANAPPATHGQTRPTHRQNAVFQVENHREVDRGAARNMARLMSVSLTEHAVVDRRKT